MEYIGTPGEIAPNKMSQKFHTANEVINIDPWVGCVVIADGYDPWAEGEPVEYIKPEDFQIKQAEFTGKWKITGHYFNNCFLLSSAEKIEMAHDR